MTEVPNEARKRIFLFKVRNWEARKNRKRGPSESQKDEKFKSNKMTCSVDGKAPRGGRTEKIGRHAN